MTEPRIVSPKEAQKVSGPQPTEYVARLAHTVATEPDRTRAAVAKALRAWDPTKHGHQEDWADVIEDGADW